MNWEDLAQSTMRIGQQQDTWKDLGSCFLAPIYSTSDYSAQFVITAYHVVSEAFIKQEQILVLDRTGKIIPASIVCCSQPSSSEHGNDFAILRLHETSSFKPIPCSKDIHPGPIIIRGRPDGLETEFAFVRGYFNGLEHKKGGTSAVLDLTSPDFYSSRIPSSDKEEGLIPHEVWRGMSGSPIVMCKADNQNLMLYVIGIFCRLSSGGRAGRAYGVPMSLIEAECNSKNLVIDLEKPYKSELDNNVEYFVIVDLFGGMDDPDRERGLWDWISNLFYRGVETDRLLNNLLNFPEQNNLDASDIAIMHYFLGRFFLKRGNIVKGEYEFYKALNLADQASSTVKQRLKALVQGRLAVETNSGDIPKRLDNFLEALKVIENIKNVSDKYIVSELDSLIGRNATSLFLEADEFTPEASLRIDQLVLEHEDLLKNNPVQLAKQDVVGTLLQCLCFLWGIRQTSSLVDEIINLSNLGFIQTERRKNSIFYIQMLCIRAIAYGLSGEEKKSFSLFSLVGKLLHYGKITFKHEGISEIYHYLKYNFPQGIKIMEISYHLVENSSLTDRIEALTLAGISRQEAMEVEFKATEWLEEIPDWHTLYKVPSTIFDR